MLDWISIGLLIGLGFTAAAILGNSLALVGGAPPGFAPQHATPLGVALAFAMVMFTGPYLVSARLVDRWRLGDADFALLAGGVALMLAWSFLGGIVVSRALVLLGVIAA